LLNFGTEAGPRVLCMKGTTARIATRADQAVVHGQGEDLAAPRPVEGAAYGLDCFDDFLG
jgi:hypothetical protein